jgi:rhodanese-related sulfurtransferase
VTNNAYQNEVGDMGKALLDRARQRAQIFGVKFAGLVYPAEAWTLFRSGVAVLIDVRTAEERKYVGRVPETPHVAWRTGLNMAVNPKFLQQIRAISPKDSVVLLLSRSGGRSTEATEALAQAGYVNAFNVLEGFEGELDNHQQRGTYNGWRYSKLPWVQD